MKHQLIQYAPVPIPSMDPKPLEYADISSQLLLRTYHHRDVNETSLSQELRYLGKETHAHN